jgi:hypothetical protein
MIHTDPLPSAYSGVLQKIKKVSAIKQILFESMAQSALLPLE